MEADWEFEIGPGAPVIDAHWSGYIDLRAHPEQAAQLPEASQFPALASALVQLNAPPSPVWTSKCDLWCVDLSETPLDSLEMDTPSNALAAAHACYIDILARQPLQWPLYEDAANFCRALCARLRIPSLHCTRVDLIIRRAVLVAGEESFGVTAYLTACGASEVESAQILALALTAFAEIAAAT